MEVHGEADMADDDEMQVAGQRRVVYVLHPNCNVENFGSIPGDETQPVEQ
jgi:hypothetical protein